MHEIIAYLEHRNRAQSIGKRGEFIDDIRGWFVDVMCDMSNSDVRVLMQHLAEGNDQAVGTMIEAALVKAYGEKAKEFAEEQKRRVA